MRSASKARSRRVREAPTQSYAELATRYIESSAVVAVLLEQDASARKALRVPGRQMTSTLTIVESHRAIVRARAAGRISAEEERAALLDVQDLMAGCIVVDIADAVIRRASRPFPMEPVRTLDAIHLATAELLGDAPQLVTVITRDSRVRDNARAMGFAVE